MSVKFTYGALIVDEKFLTCPISQSLYEQKCVMSMFWEQWTRFALWCFLVWVARSILPISFRVASVAPEQQPWMIWLNRWQESNWNWWYDHDKLNHRKYVYVYEYSHGTTIGFQNHPDHKRTPKVVQGYRKTFSLNICSLYTILFEIVLKYKTENFYAGKLMTQSHHHYYTKTTSISYYHDVITCIRWVYTVHAAHCTHALYYSLSYIVPS